MYSAGRLSGMETPRVQIVKAKGRLKALAEKTNDGEALKAPAVSDTPYGRLMESLRKPTLILTVSYYGNVVGVHNGIIIIIRSCVISW